MTGVQGKGFYVNAQDSQMLREQHLRKVEQCLTDAIQAAKIAGMTRQELMETMEALFRCDA